MKTVNRKLVLEIANSSPEEIESGKFPGVKFVDSTYMAVARKGFLEIDTGFFHDVFYPEHVIPVDDRVYTIYHEVGHYFSDYFKKYLKRVDPSSLTELKNGGNHPFVLSSKNVTIPDYQKTLRMTRYIFQSPNDFTSNPKLLHEEAIADAFAEYFTTPDRKASFKAKYPDAFSWFDKHAKCITDFDTPVKGLVVDIASACKF